MRGRHVEERESFLVSLGIFQNRSGLEKGERGSRRGGQPGYASPPHARTKGMAIPDPGSF